MVVFTGKLLLGGGMKPQDAHAVTPSQTDPEYRTPAGRNLNEACFEDSAVNALKWWRVHRKEYEGNATGVTRGKIGMAFRIGIPWQPPPNGVLDIPFHAQFEIDSQSGDFDSDEEMCELWEQYRRRHAEHVKEFAKRLVALYRGVTVSADLPNAEILKLTKRATIIVYRNEFDGEKDYSLRVQFQLAWDDEHGYSLEFDENTQTFGSWQD